MFRLFLPSLLVAASAPFAFAQNVVIGFEDLPAGYATAAPGTGSYANGEYYSPSPTASYNTTFTSYGIPGVGATFNTTYSYYGSPPGYSSGWSTSSVFNNVTIGDANQYAAYNALGATGTNGAGGSARYAIANNYSQGDATVQLPTGYKPLSMAVTNTTYVYQMITTGFDPNGFMKGGKFGGAEGTLSDFLLLTVIGKNGTATTGTKEIYLAAVNYTDIHGVRVPNAMLDRWTTFDLSSLGAATSLEFDITSSRNNLYGNTVPAYFAADNLVLTPVPEPGMILALGAGMGLLVRWRRVK